MTLEPTQFATETQLWNAILRQFGQKLPLAAGHLVLTEAEAPAVRTPAFAIAVGPDISLSFLLRDFPFARLTGVEITLAEIQALPQSLSDSLLLAAVEAVRTVLPPALMSQVVLPAEPGTAADRETWLEVEIDIGSGAIARGLIGGRRQDFVQVAARLYPQVAGQPAPVPAALLYGLSIEVAVAASQTALPLAAVRALAPGDVILAPLDPDQRLFTIAGREVIVRAPAASQDDRTPATGWTVKEIRMTADTPDNGAEALSLDQVPLTLRFVTEDQRIALSDLQGLAQGALLPLAPAALVPGLPLRIQANGVTIGEGHLVQIDDRLAVRIARLVPKAV